MPSRQRLRPLKRWRYLGVYGPELMLCLANVRIGPARQAFWAVWDRTQGELHERTMFGRGTVRQERGRARVHEPELQLDLRFPEEDGIETVCASGRSYAWTRKQGGVEVTGSLVLGGQTRPVIGRGLIDDTAGYYERHTRWRWSAGIGLSCGGQQLAWNLVSGVNDPPRGSERTVWIDGQPAEAPPCRFAPDLRAVDELRFHPEALREHRENRLLVRSNYRQPFGTFSGELPGGVAVVEGYGVMEEHDVWW